MSGSSDSTAAISATLAGRKTRPMIHLLGKTPRLTNDRRISGRPAHYRNVRGPSGSLRELLAAPAAC
jgi:hypothetical protein